VEAWVVRAIGRRLLEGKMDQPGGRLLIIRSTQAAFGAPEWAHLKQQLAAWKDSMAAVVQMAAAHKVPAPRGLQSRA
jgi:translation initiation factor 3 subunit M